MNSRVPLWRATLFLYSLPSYNKGEFSEPSPEKNQDLCRETCISAFRYICKVLLNHALVNGEMYLGNTYNCLIRGTHSNNYTFKTRRECQGALSM